MSDFTDQFEIDQKNIEGHRESTGTATQATWKGASYPCRTGFVFKSNDNERGFRNVITLTANFRRSVFTSAEPAVGDEMVIDAMNLRIRSKTLSPSGVGMSLDLSSQL